MKNGWLIFGVSVSLVVTLLIPMACNSSAVKTATSESPVIPATSSTSQPISISISDLVKNPSLVKQGQEITFTGIMLGLWQNPPPILNIADPNDQSFMVGVREGDVVPNLKYVRIGDSITVSGFINGTKVDSCYLLSPGEGVKNLDSPVTVIIISATKGLDNSNGYEWPPARLVYTSDSETIVPLKLISIGEAGPSAITAIIETKAEMLCRISLNGVVGQTMISENTGRAIFAFKYDGIQRGKVTVTIEVTDSTDTNFSNPKAKATTYLYWPITYQD